MLTDNKCTNDLGGLGQIKGIFYIPRFKNIMSEKIKRHLKIRALESQGFAREKAEELIDKVYYPELE